MSKLLVIHGYHEPERLFGKIVRDKYVRRYGSPEWVRFHQMESTRGLLGGEHSDTGDEEISHVMQEYQPSLTFNLHHSRLFNDLEERIEFEFEVCPYSVKSEWELVWMQDFLDCKYKLGRDPLFADDGIQEFNHFLVEVHLPRIRESYANRTARFLKEAFDSHCSFKSKYESNGAFRLRVEGMRKYTLEQWRRT